MPDITMCSGFCTHDGVTTLACPFASRCARYKSEPNPYRQAYFAEPLRFDEKCEYFMSYTEVPT